MGAARRRSLVARLRECGEQEMVELVRAQIEELDADGVQSLLRNPHVSTRVIELILRERRLLVSHEVQKALAEHPKTPEPRVLNLVPALYWRDLVELGGNTRVRPRVRQAADRRLLLRLEKIGTGERIAIARRAGPGVLGRLLEDRDLRVISALLENPRMTEEVLLPVVSREGTPSHVLDRIANDRKWGSRNSVRAAVARNPGASASTVLELLVFLSKSELRDIRADRRLDSRVRRRAALLLGFDPAQEPADG